MGEFRAHDWRVLSLEDFLRPGDVQVQWGKRPSVEGSRLLAIRLENLTLFYQAHLDINFCPPLGSILEVFSDFSDKFQCYDDIFIRAELELMVYMFFTDLYKYSKSLHFPEQSLGSREAAIELVRLYADALISRIPSWEDYIR